ncbi:diadenylate cyclase CdaA [Reichenbachiella carrageenanivorans]|uniref:Diadenylate cyclase n=1 Tax=Reichenbachiella carrageenanivorans TaxID=2979869 RepID=A0ABY6D474_9BACT|nr:diadenylate cyclase CdaA [Reichenbachiella carrageenanivorans]UXX80946.1 diadenylate cyclase CdaA [Reichenbachiella carrageenanivorans]
MILGFQIGFLEIGWVDVFDILFVSFFLYHVYKLMKGSVAIKIFLGFLFLYLIYLVVKAVDMELLSIILGQFMGVGVIAVIVLFQQEIRKFLLLLGKTTVFEEGNILKNVQHFFHEKYDKNHLDVSPIIDGIKNMAGSNTGALIVFSRSSELKFFADSGDRLEAKISKRLIMAIFNKHSPLHDGAIIINNNRIVAARCILPVSERDDIPAQYGLRHRAALGMSETTDSLVVIVSEETGQLTVARGGSFEHNLSTQEVRARINEYLSNLDDTKNESLMTKAIKPDQKEKISKKDAKESSKQELPVD